MRDQWRRWILLLASRRFGIFLCLLGFIWGVTLTNMTINSQQKESERLKEEIIGLSEKYVKALSRENQNVVDGPYAGRFTGYDLKKTMAVLLESILNRLNQLEDRVESAIKNGSLLANVTKRSINSSALNAKDLIAGRTEECKLVQSEKNNYPHCEAKMAWMRQFWKTDKCYGELGVDGSDCSIIMYLSEVENWCPKLQWRRKMRENSTTVRPMATLRLDLSGLMILLKDPGPRHNYEWIRQRITRMWDKWAAAATNLQSMYDMSKRTQKKILIHLGFLTRQSNFRIAENAFRGGPLGELVQWSDIISSLYILGHDLTITSEVEQLQGILSQFPNANIPCQIRDKLPIHMIVTDIVGLIQFKRKVRNGYGKFSCLLRVVDSFGTEPAFNFEPFAKTHGMKTSWGMQNLNPQQFFTMFPHSPDNSFMGFVVEQHVNDSHARSIQRVNQAVVYGKNEYMWQGKAPYLDIIKQYMDVHGTIYLDRRSSSIVPGYVVNHGLLGGKDLHALLRQSKIFIGLGFPYEGPAPLEAIANGCVFIQPSFNPPHSSKTTNFFKGKPTQRELTSQHPYAEMFIGEPHVYTVNVNSPSEVHSAVQRAVKALADGEVQPYKPFEFTMEGMLQRLSVYIEQQEFCLPQPKLWVPKEAVQVLVSPPGVSCKDTCMRANLICEPSHFKRINTQQTIEQLVGEKCDALVRKDDIVFPAYAFNLRQCILQAQDMLFSCVGEAHDVKRICPCRNYVQGQTALCQQCL